MAQFARPPDGGLPRTWIPSSTQLTFDGGLTRAWVDVRGSLDNVLDHQLPLEMTRVVMAWRFGAPLPRWADEAMAWMALPLASQAGADARCREALAQGRAIRLTALFALREPPDADAVCQAHSVVRFLLARDGRPAASAGPQTAGGRDPGCAALLKFVSGGMSHGWDRAAEAVYGFEDVNALEAAWIAWMKGKESQLPPPPKIEPPPRAHPPLIPPVKLSYGP